MLDVYVMLFSNELMHKLHNTHDLHLLKTELRDLTLNHIHTKLECVEQYIDYIISGDIPHDNTNTICDLFNFLMIMDDI